MFGRKNTVEEVLKLFSALSDEDKQKFLGAVNNSDSDPDEGKGEEEGDAEPAPAGETDSTPPTKEADPPADSAPSEEPPGGETPTEEPPAEPTNNEPPVEPAPPVENPASAQDSQVADNTATILEGLTERVKSLEVALKDFAALKEQMEQYTQKQADSFGYNGTIPGIKKDYKDMSAAELKNEILTGGN